MNIPYTVEARPDTGTYNGKLGMWLFIASEVMLFGGLFSAYVLLRMSSNDWPSGPQSLNVVGGAINTFVLLASAVTFTLAMKGVRSGDLARCRKFLWITAALACVFMAVKGWEYFDKISHGHYPATHVFYGIYFVITGLHVLHVIGGVMAIVWHAGPGARMHERNAGQYVNRIEVTQLYWRFVDVVWLVIFPVMYLT